MGEPAEGDGIRVARRFFEMWGAGVRKVDEGYTHPEIELHTPLSSTQGGPYGGYDRVRRWLADVDEQLRVFLGHDEGRRAAGLQP